MTHVLAHSQSMTLQKSTDLVVYSVPSYVIPSNDFNAFIEKNKHSFTDHKKLALFLENDHHLHFRVKPTRNYIFFGDLDSYPHSIDKFISTLNDFLNTFYQLSFDVQDFKYTTNDNNHKSFHFAIPFKKFIKIFLILIRKNLVTIKIYSISHSYIYLMHISSFFAVSPTAIPSNQLLYSIVDHYIFLLHKEYNLFYKISS